MTVTMRNIGTKVDFDFFPQHKTLQLQMHVLATGKLEICSLSPNLDSIIIMIAAYKGTIYFTLKYAHFKDIKYISVTALEFHIKSHFFHFKNLWPLV